MAKYRKKPIEVEAVQWTGENPEEVINFIGKKGYYSISHINEYGYFDFAFDFKIYTLEGVMDANIGDYIIKGIKRGILPL